MSRSKLAQPCKFSCIPSAHFRPNPSPSPNHPTFVDILWFFRSTSNHSRARPINDLVVHNDTKYVGEDDRCIFRISRSWLGQIQRACYIKNQLVEIGIRCITLCLLKLPAKLIKRRDKILNGHGLTLRKPRAAVRTCTDPGRKNQRLFILYKMEKCREKGKKFYCLLRRSYLVVSNTSYPVT